METTIVHWGYIGIMENEMETTILPKLIAAGFQAVSIHCVAILRLVV